MAGSGSLYAKPSGFTMTGLYYNKELASQIGMTTPPASVDDLTTLLGKAKAGGLTAADGQQPQGGVVLPLPADVQHRRWASSRSPTGCSTCPDSTINTPDSVQGGHRPGRVGQGRATCPTGVNGMDGTDRDGRVHQRHRRVLASGNWERPR